MDILNPPKNYINYRCATHEKEGTEYDEARKKFYKEFKCKEEIIQCFNWLHEARNSRTLPVEKIEIREDDGLKHGRVVPMMIYDIEYWREGDIVKQRKIYMPLERLYAYSNSFTQEREIQPTLEGEEAQTFEQKRKKAKERLPYKDDEDQIPF